MNLRQFGTMQFIEKVREFSSISFVLPGVIKELSKRRKDLRASIRRKTFPKNVLYLS